MAGPIGERSARAPAADLPERRHEPVAAPTTGDLLLDLQRRAGNRMVGRWIARSRRLARVSVEDVAAARNQGGEFAAGYPAWLETKRAVTGASEKELLSAFTLAELKDAVQQYGVHQRNYAGVTTAITKTQWPWQRWFTDARSFLKTWYRGELAPLKRSATLQTHCRGKLGDGLKGLEDAVDRALEPLAPRQFEERYFGAAKERALELPKALASVDHSRGFRAGDAFYLRIGSGTDPGSLHTPVHEFMHFLSDPVTKTLLGHDLNEGLTELIAKRVMEEVVAAGGDRDLFKWPGTVYAAERAKVERLVQHLNTPTAMDDLIALYFSFMNAKKGLIAAIEAFKAQVHS